MSQFLPALATVLEREGAYQTYDGQGGTNRGVTQADYDAFRLKNGLETQPVARMTEPETKAFYEELWFEQPWGQVAEQDIANFLFQLAVVEGPKKAAECLQKALNSVGSALQVDGSAGGKTISATNQTEPKTLLPWLKIQAARRFLSMVKANKGLLPDLVGWLDHRALY